ncbi:MAG: nitroreductase family deazaflavin-dependent oxidoreductase [Anaerolineae bacterium]|nr:nitroreductase family deazaflavin-dependent oxidoreductase [Anaerolineae bacterium]
MDFLNRGVNPVVKWLLRSPLHFLLSARLLLITVHGRKSGKLYTYPVEYSRVGPKVMIITFANRQWWRNLINGAEVTLHLRGKSLRGQARVKWESAEVSQIVNSLFSWMKPERAAKFAAGKVAVEIDLV